MRDGKERVKRKGKGLRGRERDVEENGVRDRG